MLQKIVKNAVERIRDGTFSFDAEPEVIRLMFAFRLAQYQGVELPNQCSYSEIIPRLTGAYATEHKHLVEQVKGHCDKGYFFSDGLMYIQPHFFKDVNGRFVAEIVNTQEHTKELFAIDETCNIPAFWNGAFALRGTDDGETFLIEPYVDEYLLMCRFDMYAREEYCPDQTNRIGWCNPQKIQRVADKQMYFFNNHCAIMLNGEDVDDWTGGFRFRRGDNMRSGFGHKLQYHKRDNVIKGFIKYAHSVYDLS